MSKEATIIGVINSKGGVGKTAISINISHILSIAGYNVLHVDMDPQGSGSELIQPLNNYGSKLSKDDILKLDTFRLISESLEPRQFVFKTKYNNLDIIPNARSVDKIFDEGSFAARLAKLPESSNKYLCFANNLDRLRCDYDYIIIDSQPSLDDVLKVTTIACDYVISPLAPDIQNLRTVSDTLNVIDYCNKKYTRDTSFLGFFLNNVKNTKSISYKKVHKYYSLNASEYFVQTPIRYSDSIDKAGLSHELWMDYFLEHLTIMPNPCKDLLKILYQEFEILQDEDVDKLMALGIKEECFQ